MSARDFSLFFHSATLPGVDVSSGSPEVSYEERLPLSLPHLPLAVSYSLFQRCAQHTHTHTHTQPHTFPFLSHVLADPTNEEEELSSGQVSVILLSHLKTGRPDCTLVGGLTKSGPPSLPSQRLIELTQHAQKRAKVLANLLLAAAGDKTT